MVVTGGEVGSAVGSRVQVYSTAGVGERLPNINTARHFHACGHYIKDDKVVTYYIQCMTYTLYRYNMLYQQYFQSP